MNESQTIGKAQYTMFQVCDIPHMFLIWCVPGGGHAHPGLGIGSARHNDYSLIIKNIQKISYFNNAAMVHAKVKNLILDIFTLLEVAISKLKIRPRLRKIRNELIQKYLQKKPFSISMQVKLRSLYLTKFRYYFDQTKKRQF